MDSPTQAQIERARRTVSPSLDEVEVYLGEGIWWRISRSRLPKRCSLPIRPSYPHWRRLL